MYDITLKLYTQSVCVSTRLRFDRPLRRGSLYTLVTRPAGGGLEAVPYHEAFAAHLLT